MEDSADMLHDDGIEDCSFKIRWYNIQIIIISLVLP